MKLLKRISRRLNLKLESFLDRIENLEAIANCALQEIHQAATKARSQYSRVQTDIKKMEERICKLHEEKSRWINRALKSHHENEVRALECIRRLRIVEKEIASLIEQKNEYTELQTKLKKELEKIEAKVQTLQKRSNSLSSRQVNAQAFKLMVRLDSNSLEEIDTLFERWESKVAAYEANTENNRLHPNDFVSKLNKEKEERELKELLKNILENQKQ